MFSCSLIELISYFYPVCPVLISLRSLSLLFHLFFSDSVFQTFTSIFVSKYRLFFVGLTHALKFDYNLWIVYNKVDSDVHLCPALKTCNVYVWPLKQNTASYIFTRKESVFIFVFAKNDKQPGLKMLFHQKWKFNMMTKRQNNVIPTLLAHMRSLNYTFAIIYKVSFAYWEIKDLLGILIKIIFSYMFILH